MHFRIRSANSIVPASLKQIDRKFQLELDWLEQPIAWITLKFTTGP
jgi:hypothetical protein